MARTLPKLEEGRGFLRDDFKGQGIGVLEMRDELTGMDPEPPSTGFVYDPVNEGGTPVRSSSTFMPQDEFIAAYNQISFNNGYDVYGSEVPSGAEVALVAFNYADYEDGSLEGDRYYGSEVFVSPDYTYTAMSMSSDLLNYFTNPIMRAGVMDVATGELLMTSGPFQLP